MGKKKNAALNPQGDSATKQSNDEQHKIAKATTRKRQREVQVVQCPSAFPISKKQRDSASAHVARSNQVEDDPRKREKDHKNLLDFYETAREIRSLGATAFVKEQKRNFADEQYKLLTGRERKKQHVPLPIVRGLKKAAAKRQARQLAEAKQAGIVLPKAATAARKNDATSRVYGPAPSVGFLNKGVLRVKEKPR